MAAVVIRKKDVNRIGKGLLKEMFEFLHDERSTKRIPKKSCFKSY